MFYTFNRCISAPKGGVLKCIMVVRTLKAQSESVVLSKIGRLPSLCDEL